MDRKEFPGRPLPSRSRGWAIASAIDHVSVVRNKVLDEQACHAAVDHRHYSRTEYRDEGSEFHNFKFYLISTCYTLHEKLRFTRVSGYGYRTRVPEV
ncbi:hypothetical protein N7501_001453 [Penicillium viridicatum]|nr:hypothetical protein N7501_001453 [Penicillium viridicatum]